MRYLVYLLLAANLVYFGWNLFNAEATVETARELPPLPASATPLVTLQEMEQQSKTAKQGEETGIESLTMKQPPSAMEPLACQALGPFHATEELQTVSARLVELGLEPRQRISKDSTETSYWVYLPGMERARALEIARRLDKLNDHDYYIGKDNYMSLGIFREMSRAEIRLQQVHKLGLNAILEAHHVTQDAFWLEFQHRGVAAPVLREVMGRNPELELHEVDCT